MIILNKIILSKQNRWSKSLSSIGSIIGLVIILISVQIYIDIQEIVNKNPNTITNDYLVLSKKIAKLSFLSKEKSYFTETELSILNLLIVEKEVPKKRIKTTILNLQTSLETKSLESHLSRIRKKLFQIDSKINIITNEEQKVIIS